MSWLAILIIALGTCATRADSQDLLRFRLESLNNELELLLRNQRSDASDLQRVRRASESMRIGERIPLDSKLGELRAELKQRAQASAVRLLKLELLGRDRPKRPIPSRLFSDTPKFKLEPDQLAETLHLRLVLAGDLPEIEEWIQRWPYDQLRLIEPEYGYERPGVKQLRTGRFEVRARAYRFRKVDFPKLIPRDPFTLLPDWARRHPGRFATTEPALWRFVEGIRENIPKTEGPFETLGQLLLEKARMSFFLSKAK